MQIVRLRRSRKPSGLSNHKVLGNQFLVIMFALSTFSFTLGLYLTYGYLCSETEGVITINDSGDLGYNALKDQFGDGKSWNKKKKNSHSQCMSVPDNMRFDCFPTKDITPEKCVQRGCCWSKPGKADLDFATSKIEDPTIKTSEDFELDVPYCFYPPSYSLYTTKNIKNRTDGISATMVQNYKSGYPNDISLLKFEVYYETCSRVRIRILDAVKQRWETPLPVVPDSREVEGCRGKKMYWVDVTEDGQFVVGRNDTSMPLFDTRDSAAFVYSDQFIQLSTFLPSSIVYGLGQHIDGLLLDLYWKRKTFWNADAAPQPQKNLYGSHPFYMSIEKTGFAHGVFLLNSNAMDVILQPTPALTFRTIGGIIDLYVFMGPTPADVITQYTDVIGKPFLPPYWSLGYHQCRFGYKNVSDLEAIWKRTRDAGIPFDVQWSDIDYMENRNDFTIDQKNYADLPKFVDKLHDNDMHYIIIVDPGITNSETPGTYPPYDLGLKEDIFVKNSSDQMFIGKVWNPTTTVFPDFTLPRTTVYWSQLIRDFRKKLSFDGLWIDMNEPANFWNGQENNYCPSNSSIEEPYYVPAVTQSLLSYKTLCMTAKHYLGLHYNVHNLYGFAEAISTYTALELTDGISEPFIISRSHFPGIGKFAGHWTGDIHSDWFNMRRSIGDILTTGLLGIPMVGADICGFGGNTTVALCNRWMQLGAFYPFSRNHNADEPIAQDPVALGELVVNSSRKALTQRYTLLPYLYTLFYEAHISGIPVARPLFFSYPEDTETYSIDTQFTWGSNLMILPVLEEGAESVLAYFPKGRWFDWYTGVYMTTKGGEYLNVSAPLDTIPITVSGGAILPLQMPGDTTKESFTNPVGLLVALDENMEATGELVKPTNTSFHSWTFEAFQDKIISTPQNESVVYEELYFDHMYVYGMDLSVYRVTLNNQRANFTYNPDTKVLFVEGDYFWFNETIIMRYYYR